MYFVIIIMVINIMLCIWMFCIKNSRNIYKYSLPLIFVLKFIAHSNIFTSIILDLFILSDVTFNINDAFASYPIPIRVHLWYKHTYQYRSWSCNILPRSTRCISWLCLDYPQTQWCICGGKSLPWRYVSICLLRW